MNSSLLRLVDFVNYLSNTNLMQPSRNCTKRTTRVAIGRGSMRPTTLDTYAGY